MNGGHFDENEPYNRFGVFGDLWLAHIAAG
jgi:hypothetical protein